jgi:hypothetical protein
MWNLCNNSTPSRKLVKARRVNHKKTNITLDNNGIDDKKTTHYTRLSLECKAIDDFESDIAWVAAWDTRKKIRVFYCSRVLRKLRRRKC